MRAGLLDRKVSILRAATAPNAFNEPVETWRPVLTLRAAYEPVSVGERLRAGEVAAYADARFRVRWSRAAAEIGPTDRLVFEADEFNILGVTPIGRRVLLEISAKARGE